jgi:hypothetical protein
MWAGAEEKLKWYDEMDVYHCIGFLDRHRYGLYKPYLWSMAPLEHGTHIRSL